MSKIHLVSCVSKKMTEAAPARDLHSSAWFKKARVYVEQRGARWYILSPLYGLVSPDAVIEPYEKTLKMPAAQRRAWARGVFDDLVSREVDPETTFVILAGEMYRRDLVPLLTERGHAVEVPMEGLGIGQQLSWLDAHAGS